jgi:general secretion pathway protein H
VSSGASAQRGVTLLEMLVVLMLIGLASSIVLPRMFSGPSQAELRSATRQIAAGLRMARTTAVTQRRPVMLELDLEHPSFRLDTETRARVLPEGIALSLFTARRDVIDAKRGGIRFFPDGGSNGGRVTLAAGERRFNVDVDWLTGRVSIVE